MRSPLKTSCPPFNVHPAADVFDFARAHEVRSGDGGDGGGNTLSFEAMGMDNGFALYEANITVTDAKKKYNRPQFGKTDVDLLNLKITFRLPYFCCFNKSARSAMAKLEIDLLHDRAYVFVKEVWTDVSSVSSVLNLGTSTTRSSWASSIGGRRESSWTTSPSQLRKVPSGVQWKSSMIR